MKNLKEECCTPECNCCKGYDSDEKKCQDKESPYYLEPMAGHLLCHLFKRKGDEK